MKIEKQNTYVSLVNDILLYAGENLGSAIIALAKQELVLHEPVLTLQVWNAILRVETNFYDTSELRKYEASLNFVKTSN